MARNIRAISRIEPAIAFWPQRANTWERLGDRDFPNDGGSSESFIIQLRPIVHGDAYMPSERSDAVRSVVLYTWLSGDSGTHKIELLVHDLNFASQTKVAECARVLRGMNRAAAGRQYTTEPFQDHLLAVLKRLGIDKCAVYNPEKWEFEYFPLDHEFKNGCTALGTILEEFERRRVKTLRAIQNQHNMVSQ